MGILHDNPVSAANLLNKVYSDIDIWWNEPERQAVRRLACKIFAGTTEYALEDWVRELDNIFIEQKAKSFLSLDEYFGRIEGSRIALLGANNLSEYLISLFKDITNKEIIGVIDPSESYCGALLEDIPIDSCNAILTMNPDTIIISDFLNAKQKEKQLSQYIVGKVDIINLARDLPEHLFRVLVAHFVDGSIDYI
jgi:hypothetical protein